MSKPSSVTPVELPSVDPPIRGFLHVPASEVQKGIVLTHGAGANCQSPLLTGLAIHFCAAGLTALRCDLPFRQARPYGPPARGSSERDQLGLKRAVEWMFQQNVSRVFLGGHSYGGRQASMLGASEPDLVSALLLLSYPLHPPNKPTQMRTAHFPNLRTPALFVSGTRDEFGTVAELTEALALVPARVQLLTIEGVGHHLLPKRGGEEVLQRITENFNEFVS